MFPYESQKLTDMQDKWLRKKIALRKMLLDDANHQIQHTLPPKIS